MPSPANSNTAPAESELVLRPDGRVYHINVKGDEIADTVILVGDPQRVEQVAKHFDSVRVARSNREFCVQTGSYQGVPITVLSTGIGCDNIVRTTTSYCSYLLHSPTPSVSQVSKLTHEANFLILSQPNRIL